MGNRNPSGRGIGGEVYSTEGLAPTICVNKGSGYTVMDSAPGEMDEPQMLTMVRTPEERLRRHLYGDSGAGFASKTAERRTDGVSNTVTTVLKDNLVSEPGGPGDVPVSTHPTGRHMEFRGFSRSEAAPCLRATDYKNPHCIITDG